MKLVSMKITKADRDARMEMSAPSEKDAPAYPWGLSLNLDTDVLDKLDVDLDDYKVGETVTLCVQCEVTSLSINETRGSGENKSLGLQITDLGFMDDESEDAESKTKALYNGDKAKKKG
jgi:hypothetical protein